MVKGIFTASIKYIVIEPILDLLYFPVWWYSRGAKKMFIFLGQKIVFRARKLGVHIWVLNFFKPMYNQKDWQSFFISLFMRLFQIIFRSIILIIWTGLLVLIYIGWLILPIFVIYQIVIKFL